MALRKIYDDTKQALQRKGVDRQQGTPSVAGNEGLRNRDQNALSSDNRGEVGSESEREQLDSGVQTRSLKDVVEEAINTFNNARSFRDAELAPGDVTALRNHLMRELRTEFRRQRDEYIAELEDELDELRAETTWLQQHVNDEDGMKGELEYAHHVIKMLVDKVSNEGRFEFQLNDLSPFMRKYLRIYRDGNTSGADKFILRVSDKIPGEIGNGF